MKVLLELLSHFLDRQDTSKPFSLTLSLSRISPINHPVCFRVAESSKLEMETKEMESRLLVLQDQVKAQNLDMPTLSQGSSKWKSSNTSKGSIRAYGKEVTEKFKKRIIRDGTMPMVLGSHRNSPSTLQIDQTQASGSPRGNFSTRGNLNTCSELIILFYFLIIFPS
jgi:hypothetical protein